MVVFLVFFTSS